MLKKIIILFLLINSLMPYCFAQRTDTLHYYVDHYQKPVQQENAIFHIRVYKEKPTDTDWKREMYGYIENNLLSSGRSKDAKGENKHGDYRFFYIEGNKSEMGRFENNKKEGEWTQWEPDGKVQSIFHFNNGKMTGSNLSWHTNGKILDSFALDNNGNGLGYGFYEDGIKKYEGKFTGGLKTGTWTYYYDLPRYHRSMEVVFEADSLVASKCFNLQGETQNLCIYEKEADFIGGERAWRSYLVQELTDADFARYMKKRNIYEVIVRFMVSKDGSVSDVKVENRGIKKLDKIAEAIISKSPAWKPAIQYNQKVNAYRRQPITFAVD